MRVGGLAGSGHALRRRGLRQGDGQLGPLLLQRGELDVRRLFDRPKDDNEKVIAGRLQKAPFWRLTPTWIRLIDSTKGFGWKWETSLTAS